MVKQPKVDLSPKCGCIREPHGCKDCGVKAETCPQGKVKANAGKR